MAFSGAVKIGDVNDFIAPSQACVITLDGNKLLDTAEAGSVQLQPRSSSLQAPAPGPVKVTLHDCLACSGCVTSAETVLLQHQSVEELVARLADPAVTVVVSLSPQSVTSLAVLYGLPPGECAEKLATFLRQRGAHAVFDIAWARDVALMETAHEFVHRHRMAQAGAGELAGAAEPPLPLPMLASACPGWVCYAEKTHGTFVLPHISSAKSPQAVMGTAIKRRWCSAAGVPPASVYHCAVMPCYDKKLEASRDDFNLPGSATPETDSVLVTTELHDLLQTHAAHLPALPATPLDEPFTNAVTGARGRFYGAAGGSGGYLEHVFRTAARELHGVELPVGQALPLVAGRNPDIWECTLEAGGHRVLRFAAAYGFRNIQGLMRKIKLGRCEYDYVEVMACPSGCLNGGGQVKPCSSQNAHQLIAQLEAAYHGDWAVPRSPELNPSVQALYREWVLTGPYSPRARELFHTQYHRREKSVSMAIGDW